jgi:hypothetical protein
MAKTFEKVDWMAFAGRTKPVHEKPAKKCKYCRAEIIMIQNQKGAWIPAQRVTQVWGRSGPMFTLTKVEPLAGEVYISHWQTCPDAARMRADIDAKKQQGEPCLPT